MRTRIALIMLIALVAFGSMAAVAGDVGIHISWVPGILSEGAIREYRVSLHHESGDTLLVTATPIPDDGPASFAVTATEIDELADYTAYIWAHIAYPSGNEDWNYTSCASPAEYSGAPTGCSCVRVAID